MYLHLGQSVVVPFRDVVGIFDMDNSTASHLTRKFLTRAEREGQVGLCLRRSAPVLRALRGPDGGQRVYLSQLSPAALLRRAESNSFE